MKELTTKEFRDKLIAKLIEGGHTAELIEGCSYRKGSMVVNGGAVYVAPVDRYLSVTCSISFVGLVATKIKTFSQFKSGDWNWDAIVKHAVYIGNQQAQRDAVKASAAKATAENYAKLHAAIPDGMPFDGPKPGEPVNPDGWSNRNSRDQITGQCAHGVSVVTTAAGSALNLALYEMPIEDIVAVLELLQEQGHINRLKGKP